MFDFGRPRRGRLLPLAPMIDVIFLLLVFFLVASRFGATGAIPLQGGGDGQDWTGPPRLVGVAAAGVSLNGVPTPPRDMLAGLVALTVTGADPVVVQPAPGVDLQRLVDVLGLLRRGGFQTLLLVGAP